MRGAYPELEGLNYTFDVTNNVEVDHCAPCIAFRFKGGRGVEDLELFLKGRFPRLSLTQ